MTASSLPPLLRMKLLPDDVLLAVSRLEPDAPLPPWATTASPATSFFSVTRTPHELSIVSSDSVTPPDVRAERRWRALELEGPIPFALTGILASALAPLAEARIGIFALSTFDTDYILVKAADLDRALDALRAAGHVIL